MTWTEGLPPGYTGALGAPDDLEPLRDLIRRTEEPVSGPSTVNVDFIRIMLEQPGSDPTTDLATVHAADGSLVGAARFHVNDPFVQPSSNGWVDPGHRRKGIGTALIAWARARAEGAVDRAPTGTRVALSIGANEKDDAARALLERLGFIPSRYFFEMEIALDGPFEALPIPEGVTVRTMRADEDVDELTAAVTEAFRDHFGFIERPMEARIEQWRHWRTSDAWDDDLVWLAEVDGDIVGMNVSLRTNGAREDQGYVATLGVLPAHRGRGLARSLLTTSFAEYARRGMSSVSLHVDADSLTGATRLYRGVGMHEAQTEIDYEWEVRAGEDIIVR